MHTLKLRRPTKIAQRSLTKRECRHEKIFRQFANSPIRQFAKTAAVSLLCFSAYAAKVDPAELPKMAAQAQKDGATPVVVHLAFVDMAQLSPDLKAINAAMAQRSARLLAELGPQAWDAGRWENGLGQIGVHVTPSGLKILQNSGNAISFRPDQSWRASSKLRTFDGSLEAIDRALDSTGYVDAQVTLNVDGLAFDTLKEGSVSLRTTTKTTEEGRVKAKTLLDSLSTVEAPGKSTATASLSAMSTPSMTLRLTRQGVVRLAASDLVRSLKPVGFVDARAVYFDDDILKAAQQQGSAQVIIGIRTPLMGGNPSAASVAEQTQSHQRALASLLQDAGVSSKLQDLSSMGAMAGKLTLAELQNLKTSKDARLMSVELNRPMGGPALAISTATMNMPAAWSNPNFRGAGQNIVVMDTGVQSNHEFFKDAAGNSRVFFEGCFGTDMLLDGTQWVSTCPQKGPNGDSPIGMVGSASPLVNCAYAPNFCPHGTVVAGIAAGRASPLLPAYPAPTQFQGIAPDARIAAFQVLSWDPTVPNKTRFFQQDLAAVLQFMADTMTPGTTRNPFVINMSLAGQPFSTPCNNFTPVFAGRILTLLNLGVPIIAATGNLSLNVAVAWPSCLPGVIKVSAVNNDGVGNTRAPYANLPNLASFSGADDFFLLAQGGGDNTNILSSNPSSFSTTNTGFWQGTSFAAPHIAGLYAALKAIGPEYTINQLSHFIQDNMSVNVPINVCSPTSSCQPTIFKRPRWP